MTKEEHNATIVARIIGRITERAKREILDDMAEGVVPATVASFSELHDYVYANEYGGFVEPGCPLDVEFDLKLIDSIQTELDEWLKRGHPDPEE